MESIKKVDVKDKKVLVRTDYNVNIKDNVVLDDSRIIASLDTINYLIENGAKVIIMSHLKRIKKKDDKDRYSLEIVARELSKLVKTNVYFVPETRGPELEKTIEQMKSGEIVIIENTRFEDYPDNLESDCNEELSKYWASLCDIFVLDAFASCHRAHASTYGVSKYVPSYAGVLVLKEKNLLDKILKQDGITMIMGGAKVKDKIGTINNLITRSDKILIGGAMCFTFLKAAGYDISPTIYEKEHLDYAKSLLKKYNDKIILPVDFVTPNGVKKIDEFTESDIGYDIGNESIKLFNKELENSNLILWNGPLGKYEEEDYEYGTKKVLEYLYKNKKENTILAGGDIIASSTKFDINFPYISTGGGATLEYLAGEKFKTFENLQK